MLRSRLALLAALSLMSCNEADGSHETHLRPAPVTPAASAPKVTELSGPHPADIREDPEKIAETLKASGKTKKPAGEEEDWVPKEYGSGMSRWKDTGVYVDGKPLGFLAFGQLPIGCKPSWLRGKVSANKRAGTSDPGWTWARERYYKFTDYLTAIGVDLHKVKEMHIYGPKVTETLILSGRDLLSPAGSQVWFTFGSVTRGKPLPHAPAGLGTGRLGDKITSVMVYVDKKPPTLVDNQGMFLNGEEQTGVPYYGEPVRGGVRVYFDDKLAAIIKRQDLDPKQAIKGPDGEPRWRLVDFLTSHGVDTKKVVEVWSIQDEERDHKFSRDELASLTFEASSRSKGGVLLGDKQLLANAIALHSRALRPADMPLLEQPDE
jgi:hypothetical protein